MKGYIKSRNWFIHTRLFVRFGLHEVGQLELLCVGFVDLDAVTVVIHAFAYVTFLCTYKRYAR